MTRRQSGRGWECSQSNQLPISLQQFACHQMQLLHCVDAHAGTMNMKAHPDARRHGVHYRRKHHYADIVCRAEQKAEIKNRILETLTDQLGHFWCHEPLHNAGAGCRQVINVDTTDSALFKWEVHIRSGPEHV